METNRIAMDRQRELNKASELFKYICKEERKDFIYTGDGSSKEPMWSVIFEPFGNSKNMINPVRGLSHDDYELVATITCLDGKNRPMACLYSTSKLNTWLGENITYKTHNITYHGLQSSDDKYKAYFASGFSAKGTLIEINQFIVEGTQDRIVKIVPITSRHY